MLLLCLAALFASTSRALPLATFGRLPALEDIALSPDGTRIAFLRTQEDTRVLAVVSLRERRPLRLLRLGDVKLRGIEWADNQHLLLTTSVTGLPWGVSGREQEWYLLQVLDLASGRLRPIPRSLDGGLRASGIVSGRILVRHIEGRTVLFVPVLASDPGMSGGRRRMLFTSALDGRGLRAVLVRHDLASGSEHTVREGSADTQSWVVDAAGRVVAEEDYDEPQQRWSVEIDRDGRLLEVAAGHEAIDYPRMLGLGPTDDSLLLEFIERDEQVWRLLSLRDATLGAPMPERKQFETPIEDRLSDRMIGGLHVDDETHYIFFNAGMQSVWKLILDSFPQEHVAFVSSSADFMRIVVRVEGQRDGYRYLLIDLREHTAESLGEVYTGVAQPLEVRRIDYPARDGLSIPAYLTLPRGPAHALALVVLPHGGPATRDTADFDWWSQALADQGYAVLRPNYRGSSLSRHFISAGFGEWGRRMQTDLSDGVRYLAQQGIIDPKRVCIVGASYGGYAALAGVTLDPGVYRCAVAVSGISELASFLRWQQQPSQYDSKLQTRFWDRFMGVSGPEDPLLYTLSPVSHAAEVAVPVLLIHGRDDTVVPYDQSERMYAALRRAHKQVQFVTLRHEDHWLSRSETRLQMLESSVAFLRAHNPPG